MTASRNISSKDCKLLLLNRIAGPSRKKDSEGRRAPNLRSLSDYRRSTTNGQITLAAVFTFFSSRHRVGRVASITWPTNKGLS